LLEEARSLHFLIEICGFRNVVLKLRHSLELETIVLGEVSLDALNITVEVVFGVGMRSRSHLREIDHGNSLKIIDHQVKLVEVAMDEPVFGQFNDQIHQVLIDLLRVRDRSHLGHGIGIYE